MTGFVGEHVFGVEQPQAGAREKRWGKIDGGEQIN